MLAGLSHGARGLDSDDGSLGRLTLPLGVAVSGDRLFLLSQNGDLVYAYDSVAQKLRPLAGVGADGVPTGAPDSVFAEPRRFTGATNIAAFGRLLYVADPAAHRVQVFDTVTGTLVRIHAGLRDPTDVAAGGRGVYILDGARGHVYLATPRRDQLALVASIPAKAGRWSRLAVDRQGRLYLRDTEPSLLDASRPATVLDVIQPRRCDRVRCPDERITDAGAVRSRFDVPPVWSAGGGTFAMTARLADPCGLAAPAGRGRTTYTVGAPGYERRYVIDRQRRRVERRDALGRLLRRFGPLGPDGRPTVAGASDVWSPADIAQADGCVLILDERHQAVYADEPGSPDLRRWFVRTGSQAPVWRRLAVDCDGTLLLWDGGGTTVDRVDPWGHVREQVGIGQVRHAFERPPADPTPPPLIADLRVSRDHGVTSARRDALPDLRQVYKRQGVWISDWLDSDIYACQWHLIELALTEFPPGARVSVRTRTANDLPSDGGDPPPLEALAALGSWSEPQTVAAPAQPTPADLARAQRPDVLVQSGPGRFLQLLVELEGDGLATPVVRSVRVRFPYDSLRQYLPALYAAPDEQRDFLDRYLAIVQSTWTELEAIVTTFERYLDPLAVPAGAPLRYLATWLAVRLEGTWNDAQNRRLLAAAPGLLASWGTPAGLRAWIAVYLANLSGHTPEELQQAGMPGLVEGFVERRRLMLGPADEARRLGSTAGLWSPAVERRLQIGVFDREGEVELVSVGDPAVDVFRHSAHVFRVYVPSAWVRTREQEALLRRAIDAQKPAHTSYELVLVEPRFRVGVQSTVALDTVIGAALPPRDRLGYDLVLGAGTDESALGHSDLILA
jgi:phage tail-like protein